MTRVLVNEAIGESGLRLLRSAGFEVDLGDQWRAEDLPARIGDYEGILIRSQTRVTDDLLEHATRLRAIGRAGVGVDNVDVSAATKRGIVVVNAPQSNVITAAEHTLALLLALVRNIPQAHGSLVAGRWERGRFAGVELYDKTLGILGFGRIGQLVAARAHAFGMRVLAYDPFVGVERFRELGVARAQSPADIYAVADFITVHLPRTTETQGMVDAGAFAQMKPGVRILNVARGGLIDEPALKDALDSGVVAGAALDVFPSEPVTEHPLFAYPNVVVTPHLGASTAEAADRAGFQAAEQVIAALSGGTLTTAVNVAVVAREDLEILSPFVPLCRRLGQLVGAFAERMTVERVEIELHGRIAERDTRPLAIAVLVGLLRGRVSEPVNDVNARTIATERGIAISEDRGTGTIDFTDLVRATVVTADGERVSVAGTVLGRDHRPYVVEAWGQGLNLELTDDLTVLRCQDGPGVLAAIGTTLGQHGVNIRAASVGRGDGEEGSLAVMVIATDTPVSGEAIDEIITSVGSMQGWVVTLGDERRALERASR